MACGNLTARYEGLCPLDLNGIGIVSVNIAYSYRNLVFGLQSVFLSLCYGICTCGEMWASVLFQSDGPPRDIFRGNKNIDFLKVMISLDLDIGVEEEGLTIDWRFMKAGNNLKKKSIKEQE